MDFTREPIIESVITPKEGCKLVVRSSKGAGQEEFFVDAVEIVSFGHTFFLRSLERPKTFLVPATDYEVLEVRETRMVLKNVGMDRSIKIGGGRESPKKAVKETKPEPKEAAEEKTVEPKRRERRRQHRRRRGRDAAGTGELQNGEESNEARVRIAPPESSESPEEIGIGKPIQQTGSVLSTLLPPPPTLISESIERYKDNELFKDVFIPKSEMKKSNHEEYQEERASEPETTSPEVETSGTTVEPLVEED